MNPIWISIIGLALVLFWLEKIHTVLRRIEITLEMQNKNHGPKV